MDDVGLWSILGNGYAQLLDTRDANAAFSLAVLRTNASCDQIQLGVSRGSTENRLTKQDEFARFVLTPGTSAWSAHVKYDQWLVPRRTLALGWYGYGAVGTATWVADIDPTDGEDVQSRSAVAMSLSLGASLGYLKRVGSNSVRILAHVGPTARILMGDVYGHGVFLRESLGSRQRGYLGVEGSFWVQVNTVTVGMDFPIIFGRVQGLTNGRFLPTFSVAGRIELDALTSQSQKPQPKKEAEKPEAGR
ncbi:hypothetical protein [Corallococcus macrosporus]|uniref:hypothetical protein n=1 Tax=Corallococcus macrosporus TaxID=35 RepID=UPI0012FD99A9|nr:hypothetical protein [Corallococcus macrosporus]